MVKWWALPVAFGVGVLACWLILVIPAGKRADAELAAANAAYQSAKAGLDASTADVKKLAGELADKDSKLSIAVGQLQQANANASGLAKSNSALAGQLAELKSVIAAGASGLASDESTTSSLTSLLESSLSIVGQLQSGH